MILWQNDPSPSPSPLGPKGGVGDHGLPPPGHGGKPCVIFTILTRQSPLKTGGALSSPGQYAYRYMDGL